MKIFQQATTIIIILAFIAMKAEGFAPFAGNRQAMATQRHMTTEKAVIDDNIRVCLITGASRGIGKCIAKELSKDPRAKVCINYIAGMEEDAAAAVKEIEDDGGEAIAVAADCKYGFSSEFALLASLFSVLFDRLLLIRPFLAKFIIINIDRLQT